MMEQGRGERFRQPTRLERLAAGLGAMLPLSLRGPATSAYARIVRVVQPESLVANLPHGERVRLLAAHRYMGWNPDEYEAFRADVRPGDCVLDAGANAGAYTVLFAQWTGASGRVIAFEPAPDSCRALRDLLDVNELGARVTVLEEALTAEEGRASFQVDGASGANRLVREGQPRSIRVAATTIDAVCQRLGLTPSLIKIDVEGAELDVLRGARRTIASTPGLKLYVEMHPHLWTDSHGSRADIERELDLQNLRAERLDGNPDVWNLQGVCLRLVRCAS